MGYPWQTGDELLADDLNAAIANSIGLSSGTLPLNGSLPMTGPITLAGNATQPLHAVPLQQLTAATAGGPFLPLATGGTVSGRTTFTGGIQGVGAQSLGGGAAFKGFAIFSSAISGVRTGGDAQLSLLETTADTLDAGAGGLSGQYIHIKSGGAGTAGNRVGQYIDFHYSGGTLDKARGYPGQYAGHWSYAYGEGNAGGAAGSLFGVMWGGISSSRLTAGATYWAQAIGHEVNVGVASGASAGYVQGLKIAVQFHQQPPQVTDYMFGMAKTFLTDSGMQTGISFGSYDGYWPIDVGGTLIGTQGSNLPTPPAMAATNGIDFSAVTFSGAAFKSTGFTLSGTGATTINGATSLNSSVVINTGNGVTPLRVMANQNAVIPAGGFGMTLTFNLTGAGEGEFINTYGAAIRSFEWTQVISGVATSLATLSPTGAFASLLSLGVGGTSGPTWTTGSGVPSSTQPVGSLYSRVSTWAAGATLYVSKGAGAWTPVASV